MKNFIKVNLLNISLLIGILLTTFLIISSYDAFLVSIIRSWAIQFLVLLFCSLLIFVLLKRSMLVIATSISIIMLLIYLDPFLKLRDPGKTDTELTVLHLNVLKYNRQYEKAGFILNESNADIISLVETDIRWTNEMIRILEQKYPFYYVFPSLDCCYGASIFSRHPIKFPRVKYLNGYPVLTSRITNNGKTINMIIAHAPSPIYPRKWKARDRYISELAGYVKDLQGRTIVCGDFNSVPWENSIVNFLKETNMEDSRLGYQPTFPAILPFLKIPLDYIFHSKGIQNLGTDVVKGTGSDHYGVRAAFKFMDDV